MSLGENIRSLRKSKKLSQGKLASEIGLSLHAINSYESGRREPNSKAMVALEKYFNVSGEFLRGEVANKDDFYKRSETIQDELDNLANLFLSFKNEFSICAQENQLIAVQTLQSFLSNISQNVFHCDASKFTVRDFKSILISFFALNEDGREELVKRADELNQLAKYSDK